MQHIVEQIHSEFSEAEEKLMLEVDSYLKRAENVDKEKLSQLSNLGFSNFKELREIQPEEIEKAQKTRDSIIKYTGITNVYKFITKEKVIEICKKWGLVHAPVSLYIDSIPYKNQVDIFNFQKWAEGRNDLLPTERLRKSSYIAYMGKDPANMTIQEIFSLAYSLWQQSAIPLRSRQGGFNNSTEVEITRLFCDLIRQLYKRGHLKRNEILQYNNYPEIGHVGFYGDYNKSFLPHSPGISHISDSMYIVSQTVNFGYIDNHFAIRFLLKSDLLTNAIKLFANELTPQPEYTIVAAKHMVDLSNHIINDDFQVVEKSDTLSEQAVLDFFKQDDPIVLFDVDGGYYIPSAWGTEASDLDVVNQNMN